MIIKTFEGGFDKNLTYLIWCEKTKHAALIDASTEINPILECIEQNDLLLSKILITHSHHDHIAFLNDYLNILPNIIVYCFNKPINMNVEYYGLDDNEIIVIGNEIITTIYTPGHFEDSVCYWDISFNCQSGCNCCHISFCHTTIIKPFWEFFNKIIK